MKKYIETRRCPKRKQQPMSYIRYKTMCKKAGYKNIRTLFKTIRLILKQGKIDFKWIEEIKITSEKIVVTWYKKNLKVGEK